MGAVDSPQKKDRGPKKKGMLSHKKARVGIRIDMTPFVDIAFLLLIFFMTTTVFRTPQALEINLPPDENVKIEIKESNVLTVRVLSGDRAYFKRGTDPWARTTVNKLVDAFKPYKGNSSLVVLIQIECVLCRRRSIFRQGIYPGIADVPPHSNFRYSQASR